MFAHAKPGWVITLRRERLGLESTAREADFLQLASVVRHSLPTFNTSGLRLRVQVRKDVQVLLQPAGQIIMSLLSGRSHDCLFGFDVMSHFFV